MIFLAHVREAIDSLGYVKPEFDTALAIILEAHQTQHPHVAALAYRKLDPQLSAELKKKANLRANSFYSIEAFESLTEKGQLNPVHALEVTLLRAALGYLRNRTVEEAKQTPLEHLYFKIERSHADCVGCDRLDDINVGINDLPSIPPPNCEREACSLTISIQVDWLADLD